MFLLAAAMAMRLATAWFGRSASPGLRESLYEVVRLIDGDTLLVQALDDRRGQAGNAAVRLGLLGVACPRPGGGFGRGEGWAEGALVFTQEFIAGRPLRVRLDCRRVDERDRHLAYAFVADRCLNEELVRAGLARAATRPGDTESMVRRLQRAEREAQESGRGMWRSSRGELPTGTSPGVSSADAAGPPRQEAGELSEAELGE